MSSMLSTSSKLPPVASVSTIRRQLAPTVGRRRTSGVVFLVGSLPPVTDDISFMIGSYGVISRHGSMSPSTSPERGIAKIHGPLAARVGFMGSIDGSEPLTITLDNDNGKDDSESI